MMNSLIYISLETIGDVTCILQYLFVLLVDSVLCSFVETCSDSESANVIVTAGHKGIKFWDIRYVLVV